MEEVLSGKYQVPSGVISGKWKVAGNPTDFSLLTSHST